MQRRDWQTFTGTWQSSSGVRTASANSTSLADTYAGSGGRHQYRVRACNDSGCSDYSVGAPVNSALPPVAPSAVTAGAVTDAINLASARADTGP